MSTLKDKFENYEKQPDEKVWQSIMETMNNRVSTVRRRRIALVTSTAVVASIALLFAVNRNNGDGDVTQTKTVAQQRVERTATVRSEVATIEDVKKDIQQIYKYHTINRNFGDIGYNFLIDQL